MKDEEIIDLYWARDERAIEETQGACGRYCYRIAYNILGNNEDTEECLNDTWLKAWSVIPPKRPERLSLFLGTISRNLAFDKWKYKRAMKRGCGNVEMQLEELAECVPDRSTVEELVEAAELERCINQFLHTLPERECNIFLHRYWYAEDCSEIAKRYHMKLNTVKTVLFRTRGKLRDYLEKERVSL